MTADEIVREALFKLTGLIEDEDVAGLLFGAGLIVSEYLIGIVRGEVVWK